MSEIESLDVEQLEKENFDLKLRLFYLEEKTKAGLPLPNQLYSSLMQNADLQSQLNSVEEELETKNNLLIKARSVIEALNHDLSHQRTQFAQERQQLQIEMNDRLHGAIHQLENQLIASRQQIQEAHGRKLQLDDEMTQLRIVLKEMESRSSELLHENSLFADEIRTKARAIEERDVTIAELRREIDQVRRDAEVRHDETLATELSHHVPRSEHVRLEEQHRALELAHRDLEAEVVRWRTEVTEREAVYKSTTDQLQATYAELDQLRSWRTACEESRVTCRELEAQLREAREAQTRVETKCADELARQQAELTTRQHTDAERLDAEWKREYERLVETHRTEEASQRAEHERKVREVEEKSSANFKELQDVYNSQLVDAQHRNDARIAELRAEYDALAQLQVDAARTRHEDATRDFERRVDELKALQATQVQELTTVHETELYALRKTILDLEARLVAVDENAELRVRAIELAKQHAIESYEKDLAQLRELHQLHTSNHAEQMRALETRHATALEHVEQTHATRRQELEARHTEQVTKLEHDVTELTERLEREVTELTERLATTRVELERQLVDERRRSEIDLTNAHAESRDSHTTLLASIETQWRTKETSLMHQHQHELAHLQSLVDALRTQHDAAERHCATSHVALDKYDACMAKASEAREECRALRTKLNDATLELETLRGETVSVTKYHQLQDECDALRRELATIAIATPPPPPTRSPTFVGRSRTLTNASTRTLSASPVRQSPAGSHVPPSPIVQVSMFPSTPTPAPTSQPMASYGSENGMLQASSLEHANTSHKLQLRRLESENRALHVQLTLLKRRLHEFEEERRDDFVERTLFDRVSEEVEALELKLQRRETELQYLRQLSLHAPSPSSSPSLAMTPALPQSNMTSVPSTPLRSHARELQYHAHQMGIEVSALTSSDASASPSQSPPPSSHLVADLEHEVARLSKSLKARTSELATLQTRVRELQREKHALEESTVARATWRELESQYESLTNECATKSHALERVEGECTQLAHELASRDTRIEQLEHELERAQEHARHTIDALRQEWQHELDLVGDEARRHVQETRDELDSVRRAKDAELASLVSAHRTEVETMSRAHAQDCDRVSDELETRHTQRVHELETRLAAECARLETRVEEATQRRQELENELVGAQAKHARTDDERQRLELLVATLSQQMVELVQVTSHLDDDATDEIGVGAEFQPTLGLGSTMRQSSPSPSATRRTPSRSPTRSSTGAGTGTGTGTGTGGLFSPDASMRHGHGRSRDTHASSLFQMDGVHGSPLSLPMSPEHLSHGSLGTASSAPLTVAPHVTSLVRSMEAVYESARRAHRQKCELVATIAQLRRASDDLIVQHESQMSELVAQRAVLMKQLESHRDEHQTALLHEKDACLKQVTSLQEKYERDVARLESRLVALQTESRERETTLSDELRRCESESARTKEHTLKASLELTHALEMRVKEADMLRATIDQLKDAMKQASDEHKQATDGHALAIADWRAQLETQTTSHAAQATKIEHLEAQLKQAPTRDEVTLLHERVRVSEEARSKLTHEHALLTDRLETEQQAHMALRLTHNTLESEYERARHTLDQLDDEKRELQAQLERLRATESENLILQQRIAQAERRTHVVGQDQQHNIQITRRVLQELCEVLYAAKIPSSSQSTAESPDSEMCTLSLGAFHATYFFLFFFSQSIVLSLLPPVSVGYTDASASRVPGFLLGASFHYPDDAEQAVKWIKGKIHELQRSDRRRSKKMITSREVEWDSNHIPCYLIFADISFLLFSSPFFVFLSVPSVRRAFEYTLHEVDEKWKSNFVKLQSLLEQRGQEIAVLQRRLLTALGQTTTVTGTLKWK